MIDNFGRKISYLRMSVTELCNLRCRYCMPEQGIEKKHHDEMLTEDEMLLAAAAAAALGINKLRITGGEPLVKKNILSICRRIAAVPGIEELVLTTNAVLLPQFARELKASGVSRINISLDTLDPKKYKEITRCGELSDALAGLKAALDAGFERIKINTVLIGGFNEDEIEALAALTLKYPVDVRFIELMPMVDDAFFDKKAFIPSSVVLEKLKDAEPLHSDGSVARLYKLPGAQGSIGLISSVSNNFCNSCNRIRLTADGKLKPCLHSSEELSIKGLDFEGITEQFKKCILDKPQCHPELSFGHLSESNRDMNQIGG